MQTSAAYPLIMAFQPLYNITSTHETDRGIKEKRYQSEKKPSNAAYVNIHLHLSPPNARADLISYPSPTLPNVRRSPFVLGIKDVVEDGIDDVL